MARQRQYMKAREVVTLRLHEIVADPDDLPMFLGMLGLDTDPEEYRTGPVSYDRGVRVSGGTQGGGA